MEKHKNVEKIIISHEEIVKKSKEIANWINNHYLFDDFPILVGILKGCIPFFAELIKHITIDHEIDYMVVSSYHGSTKQKDVILLTLDLSSNIENRDVLIVEDIVDSGKSIEMVYNSLLKRNPKSLNIVALLLKEKKENLSIRNKVSKYGFLLKEDEFLVGFGLDYQQKMRNLPYFGVLKKELLDK